MASERGKEPERRKERSQSSAPNKTGKSSREVSMRPFRWCKTLLAKGEYQKAFSEKFRRRNFEEPRDLGGGVLFETLPPMCGNRGMSAVCLRNY